MTKEDIIALFPIKAQVTKEAIKKGEMKDIHGCSGFITLEQHLPEELKNKLAWLFHCGAIKDDNEEPVWITTEEDIDVSMVEKPCDVTFIVTDVTAYINDVFLNTSSPSKN